MLNTVDATSVTDKLLEQSQSRPGAAVRQEQLPSPTRSSPSRRAAGGEEQRGREQVPGGRGGQALRRGEGHASCRSPRSTSRSSSPTCRTSCARRSTACWCSPSSSRTTPTATSPSARCSTPTSSAPRAATCSRSSTTSSTWPRSSRTRCSSRSATLSLAELCDEHAADLPADRRGAGPRVLGRARRRSCRRRSATDPHRLRQVLKNLLSNAFKFTEHGGCTAIEHSGGWSAAERSRPAVIALSVTDTGIGISERPARHDLRGVRAGRRHDRAPATAAPASGSRSAATSSSCSAARSRSPARPGSGSTFTRLPAARRRRPPLIVDAGRAARRVDLAAPDRPGRRQTPRRRRSVYDGASRARPCSSSTTTSATSSRSRRCSSAAGMTVVAAEERRGGARASSRTRPDIDIVLMDIMMPVMNGYETIEAIRLRPELRRAADHRRHRQGRRRRARALPRGRRLGLHPEAGRHRRAAGGARPSGSRPRRRRSSPA